MSNESNFRSFYLTVFVYFMTFIRHFIIISIRFSLAEFTRTHHSIIPTKARCSMSWMKKPSKNHTPNRIRFNQSSLVILTIWYSNFLTNECKTLDRVRHTSKAEKSHINHYACCHSYGLLVFCTIRFSVLFLFLFLFSLDTFPTCQ